VECFLAILRGGVERLDIGWSRVRARQVGSLLTSGISNLLLESEIAQVVIYTQRMACSYRICQ
jgi:hypothetical protein